jgi:hypothetical protein
MGFHKPSIEDAYQAVRRLCGEISSPYNDGYTASTCKHELYLLKCWLEDTYASLPNFTNEADWEKQRLMDKLRDTK